MLFSKDVLYKLYVEEKKSTMAVAKELKTSQVTVCKYLRIHGIVARPFSTMGLKTRLGAKLSEETKEKIRSKHVGKKLSIEHRKKISQWMRMNNPHKGSVHTEESKEKQRQKMKGRKLSPGHRLKVIKNLTSTWSNPPRGYRASNWKGGISPINAKIRSSKELRLWRKSVKKRDKDTCVLCGHRSKGNHADHIKPFALFPELRTSIENGRTLCANCHWKTPTYGGRTQAATPKNPLWQ